MKDALVRIVCGLFGLAAAAYAIRCAVVAIESRDGAWYILPPLSLIFALAAYMLLRRALRSERNSWPKQATEKTKAVSRMVNPATERSNSENSASFEDGESGEIRRQKDHKPSF